jgi:outer membrane protein OmpA-like peptidoglycan-associated protein
MLAFVPAESAAQDAEAPAAVTVDGRLQQLGLDARPSSALGLDELQARIDKLVDLLEHGGLADDAREPLNALLTADRAELKQWQAAAVPAEPGAEPAQPAEAGPAPADQPAAAAEQPATTAPATATEPPPQTIEQAAPSTPGATTGTPAQQTAEQPAATTDQPAQPAEAPAQPPAATEEPAAAAAPAQPAATTEAAPAQPAAPASVEAPPNVSAAAEEQAAALLADKTPAESLADDALKARVEHYRALLDEPELSRKTAKALRQRLKTDRQALRARVAAQETAEAQQKAQAAAAQQPAQEPSATPAAPQQAQPTQQTTTQETQPATTSEQQAKQQPQALAAQPAATAAPEDAPLQIAPLLPLVLAPTVAEIPQLLQDRRPAQDLADDELNRRILAQREALQNEENYSPDDLTLFDRQLRQDRRELNSRLLADRNERAAVYKEWTNPNIDMNTEPAPGEPQAPNSIFAAEVDDEEMWDQLTAAPLEPLPRRYSRHRVVEEPEFVMNLPEVREAMPSIELDTITFGFNEAFVREEEIFDLDRIARMIESVVAAHPDEIFMIEGHTDAVGSDAYNLKLSRQRALAVKGALTRYYLIPPESLATVGLGERYLKIWTPEPEEENRRVTVRRVTPLVTGYEMEE